MSMHSCAVCVTIFSNSSIIPTGFKFTVTRSYSNHPFLCALGDYTITTDLWTSSHQQHSYILLTVHFIDADFKVHSVCLKILEVPQDHDAGSLCGVLCSMLQDWKISDKVFRGTTDNGQNIVNAIGLLGIVHTHYSWL